MMANLLALVRFLLLANTDSANLTVATWFDVCSKTEARCLYGNAP